MNDFKLLIPSKYLNNYNDQMFLKDLHEETYLDEKDIQLLINKKRKKKIKTKHFNQ